MDEFIYLNDKVEYRDKLKKRVFADLEELISFFEKSSCTMESSLIPELIQKSFALKQKEIFAHFDQKDRASWPTIPNFQKYGSWFDNSPLEILPVFPDRPPSESLIKLLKGMKKWMFSNDQIDHWKIFTKLFKIKAYYSCSREDRLYRQWIGLYFLSMDSDPWNRDVLYKKSTKIHEDATIRALVLSLAFFDLPWPTAEEYLYSCTHDTDEVVFIKSFRICGRIHDEKSMDHLRPIVKSPAAVLKGLINNNMYYPVGHAACNICPAQFAIIGTDNPDLAKIRESEMTKRLRRPLSVPVEHQRERLLTAIQNFEQPAPLTSIPLDLDKMVRIPAGEFTFGIHADKTQNEVFDWSTCSPERTIHLEEFYMDPYAVTNEQYDVWEKEFSSLSESNRRVHEHPGQKIGKLHRRNTFDDPRFKSDHPVVGIDWFDAWAYARYHGKDLPTEYQWEKAAKGNSNFRYPWGDDFDHNALRYAGVTYKTPPNNIIEWIILLNRGTKSFPETTTSSIYSNPKGVSPLGIHGLCGNSWEFTKTSFFTGEDARLPFSDFEPVELMGTREGHVVIRGGAWSSPAPLIGSSYRGFDLLTDRHTEIGFRCVYNSNQIKTKKA